jgi:hypothetical protein
MNIVVALTSHAPRICGAEPCHERDICTWAFVVIGMFAVFDIPIKISPSFRLSIRMKQL